MLFTLSHYSYQAWALAPLLAAGIVALIGLLVLFRERGNEASVPFAVLSLSVTCTLVAQAGLLSTTARPIARGWAIVLVMSLVPMAPAAFHFVHSLLGPDRFSRIWLWLSWSGSITLALAGAYSGSWFRGLRTYVRGYYPAASWLVYLIAAHLVLVGIYVVKRLRERWTDGLPDSRGRAVAQILTWGFVLGGLGFLDLLPFVGVELPRIAAFPALAFFGTCGYVCLRYRFLPLDHADRARRVIGSFPQPLVTCDEKGRIRYANPPFLSSFQYDSEDILQRDLNEILRSQDDKQKDLLEFVREDANATKTLYLTPGEGEEQKVSVRTSKTSTGTREQRFLFTLQKTHDSGAIQREIRDKDYYDELTELPNRRFLLERLRAGINRRLKRQDIRLNLVSVGIDRLSMINNTLGHGVGDELLRKAGRRISNSIGTGDVVARMGGGEFMCLVEDQESGELPGAARAIKEAFQSPFEVSRRELFLETAIGVTTLRDGEKPEELIGQASKAMHRAKKYSEDGLEVFNPDPDSEDGDQVVLETRLRRAIKRKQFELHYQPIVDLETRQTRGLEALVRWKHPKKGLVPPGDFIATVEEAGMAVSMGEMVLDKACKQAVCFPEEVQKSLKRGIHVNISANHLLHRNFVDNLEQVLEKTKLPPYRLCLEITESALISQLEAARKVLLEIQETGVELSLDDFGTGFSSLSHMSRWPVSSIKIDKSFVIDMNESDFKQSMVRGLLALTGEMDKQRIAEGIETEQDLRMLLDWGCEWGQGFFFEKPLPPDEIEDYITETV